MRRTELEQILSKHGASDELRAELMKWAAGESNPDKTQTYYSILRSGSTPPAMGEVHSDQTMMLGGQSPSGQNQDALQHTQEGDIER